MNRPALFVLAAAAAFSVTGESAWAAEGGATAGCLSEFENQLDRVPDCMKVGRRVRVDSSVSRGTATLHGGGGMMPTAVRGGAAETFPPRDGRVRVPAAAAAGQSLWSGFFFR